MKLSNYKFNITSPLEFQGDFDITSLAIFAGMNGSGKTLTNKINYFGSYIQASIPEMLKVQVYQMLTKVNDSGMDLLSEVSFVESLQEQLDSLDSNYINTIFNGIIIPDLFPENNLTGSLTYIYNNDQDYRSALNNVDAQIKRLTPEEVPESMELTEEDKLQLIQNEQQLVELNTAREQINTMVTILDFIEEITITIVIENNVFQNMVFEAKVKEFPEGDDLLPFMELKIASIMLIGEMEFPVYMTGSCRNFGNFNTFMNLVPKLKQETQQNCRGKTEEFQELINFWKKVRDEKLDIPEDESQKEATHIQERINVVEYFFSQSIDFWHKKEFLELCVQSGYSIMDTEVFLKLEKFKDSIAEHGFVDTNPMAAEMLKKMEDMFKIEDIMVEQDTLCVLQEGKRKTCASLSSGEQSILIMFMVPFYKI